MNSNLAIILKNLICLDVFKKSVIFTIFLQRFLLNNGTLNDSIISTVSSCPA